MCCWWLGLWTVPIHVNFSGHCELEARYSQCAKPLMAKVLTWHNQSNNSDLFSHVQVVRAGNVLVLCSPIVFFSVLFQCLSILMYNPPPPPPIVLVLTSFVQGLYNETRLLRTLKGNEKRHVLNKVRFIQNKERAKKSDWRCPWSTERT